MFAARTLPVESAAALLLLINWSTLAVGLVKAGYVVPLRDKVSRDQRVDPALILLTVVVAVGVVLVVAGFGAQDDFPLLLAITLTALLALREVFRTTIIMKKGEVRAAQLSVSAIVLVFVAMVVLTAGFYAVDSYAIGSLLVLSSVLPFIVWAGVNSAARSTITRLEMMRAGMVGRWILLSSALYSATEMMVPTLLGAFFGSPEVVFYAAVVTLSGLPSPIYRYAFLRGLADSLRPKSSELAWSSVSQVVVLIIIAFLYDALYPASTNFGIMLTAIVSCGVFLQNANMTTDAYLSAKGLQRELFFVTLVSISLSFPLLVLGLANDRVELVMAFPAFRALLTLAANRILIARMPVPLN